MPKGAVVEKINTYILFIGSDCRDVVGDRYSIPVICILPER